MGLILLHYSVSSCHADSAHLNHVYNQMVRNSISIIIFPKWCIKLVIAYTTKYSAFSQNGMSEYVSEDSEMRARCTCSECVGAYSILRGYSKVSEVK